MPSLRKHASFLIALVLAALGACAYAAGLGNIHVHSGLGQPLLASISLHGADLADLEPRCVGARLESMDGGFLMLTRAELLLADTRASLRVSTRQNVNEPAVKVVVNLGCGTASVHREFALLLDPVSAAPATKEAPAAASVPASAPSSAAPSAAADAKPPFIPPIAVPQVPHHETTTAAARKTFSKKHAGARRERRARLTLSAVEPVETAIAAIADDNAMLRLRLSPDLTLTGILASLQQPGAAVVETRPADEAKAAAATEQQAQPASVASADSDRQANRAAMEAIRSESLLWIRGLGILLLTSIGAMCWLLWRMREMRNAESALEWQAFLAEDSLNAAQSAHDDDEEPVRGSRASAKRAAVSDAGPADDAAAAWMAPGIAAERAARLARGAALHDDSADAGLDLSLKVEEISDAMELVEVWMALNDPAKVLDILKPFAESEQVESPLPLICLLDVHRALGDREKYEAISEKLRNTFNVKPEPWQPEHDASPLKTLGDFPHVVAKILSLWQSDDLLPYLESLLRDNRTGEREGFDVPVYRDLLRLLSIAKKSERGGADEREIGPEALQILSASPRADQPREAAPLSPPLAEPPQTIASETETTRPFIRERPKYITPSYERSILSRPAQHPPLAAAAPDDDSEDGGFPELDLPPLRLAAAG